MDSYNKYEISRNGIIRNATTKKIIKQKDNGNSTNYFLNVTLQTNDFIGPLKKNEQRRSRFTNE